MFREPLRRDPLVVGWVIVMLIAGFVALSNNTTWTGHLEADRVAGFLDLAEAFLWSFLLLLLLAWLRAGGWRGGPHRPGPPHRANAEHLAPYPWTDRWLRDWREADAQQRESQRQSPSPIEALPVSCRHGVPVDAPMRVEQAPVLRALSVSHSIVRPGSSVSVTWCFEDCYDVVVDGRPGYPACGEALVRVDQHPPDRDRRAEPVRLDAGRDGIGRRHDRAPTGPADSGRAPSR